MPQKVLKQLPKKAQEIWEETFNKSKKKFGAERAAKIAWATVKKSFKKDGDKWIMRSVDAFTFVSEQPYLRSEGTGDHAKEYFVEGVIASTEPNKTDNVELTREFLEYVIENQFKNEYHASLKGDIEHAADLKEMGERVDKDVETDEDVLKLEEFKIIDEGNTSKLWGKF